MTNKYLNDLNESQREAVLYNDGASLVIAGAGSGKTRVLTYKIAHLLTQGYMPWNILALTFTNKAAREMKERIAKVVGEQMASRIWMGTFHSIFSRILRKEAESIGFTSRFTIYDQSDSRSLIKTIIKEMNLDDKEYKPASIACTISNAKNHLVTPVMYMQDKALVTADDKSKVPLTGEIYKRYMERCRQADAMDFDDLLLYTFQLFKKCPEICEKYVNEFDYVLVDEYQDTNFAQHCIVWELTKRKQRICVVGDDAQSIYSFRGANIDNILNFKNQYNNTRIFKLEQNYRSTQNIVGAANSLIEHNNRQIQKHVFSENEVGEPIRIYTAYSDIEEAEIVINKIVEMRKRAGLEHDDFSILYRTNAQSRSFEEALRKRNIPYRIYGGLSFYQRKEIKDVIAYCRLSVNPHDEEAFKRVVNYPTRGLGQTSISKIIRLANEHNVSLWEIANNPANYQLDVNKGTLNKLATFVTLINGFITDVEQTDAEKLMTRIIHETGIMNEFKHERTPENLSKEENIQELINGAHEFVSTRLEEDNENMIYMPDFLQEVSLISDLDESDDDETKKVTLMTIHAAKGLEFPCVFIVGLEEGLFPNDMAKFNIREMEEERRLFYVAITRAEQYCFITNAKSRFRYGKTEFSNESRFLSELDKKFIVKEQEKKIFSSGTSRFESRDENRVWRSMTSIHDMDNIGTTTSHPTKVTGLKPLNTVNSKTNHITSSPTTTHTSINNTSLSEGNYIEHERFGIGQVIKIEGSGENTKATVKFENTGTKQLLLRFARFKVIG